MMFQQMDPFFSLYTTVNNKSINTLCHLSKIMVKREFGKTNQHLFFAKRWFSQKVKTLLAKKKKS